MKFKKEHPKTSGVYIIKFDQPDIIDRYELVIFNAKTKSVSDYPHMKLSDDVRDVFCKWGEKLK